jgi:hypothetical protein
MEASNTSEESLLGVGSSDATDGHYCSFGASKIGDQSIHKIFSIEPAAGDFKGVLEGVLSQHHAVRSEDLVADLFDAWQSMKAIAVRRIIEYTSQDGVKEAMAHWKSHG